MNTKKIKKLNIKVRVKQRPDLTNANSKTENKVTGFEIADFQKQFYYIGGCGDISSYTDYFAKQSKEYKSADYYTDKKLAEWCSRSDTLNRKMRRWAAEHNGEPFDWQCGNYEKYYITFDAAFYEFNIYSNTFCPYPNTVYFNTKEIAELAIKEFGNEIEWLAENRPEWF